MIRKTVFLTLLALLVAFALTATAFAADDDKALPFRQATGAVKEINWSESFKSITIEDESGERLILNIPENIPIFKLTTMEALAADNSKSEYISGPFVQEQAITAFYRDDAPVNLSIPPRLTPIAIVINNDTGRTARIITPSQGDLTGQTHEIAFYAIADLETPLTQHVLNIDTAETPAETTIDTTETPEETAETEENPETEEHVETTEIDVVFPENILANIPQEDTRVINGVKYVALANLARNAGFEVTWDDPTKTVSILRDNMTVFTITIGIGEYGYYRAIRFFTNPPVIIDSRTFVEEGFFS